ncbi:hypothetical protein J2Z35_002444 [Acetoanaerobium pronyense]|uniref:Uncharacterized protein n=1 Tax=Acetoanaerobium pronyense TaxID=1482736 RepID=A0ABS4KLG6_9FIRM|nr:hypothetical protein [Acetoanaerobium pronyense]MBP2028614.1 hypothetical protein [Acetoanaerobium pronyense]
MIYKAYKITYENLSKIMDLSIFKNHLNVGKSFSFLINVNVYSSEIESIELCDENHTPLFLSGECESLINVYDCNDILIGEAFLPSLNHIEKYSTLIKYNIDYVKINALLKTFMENTFKKRIIFEDSVLETKQTISNIQKIILSEQYDEEILNIKGYETLNSFFKYITKEFRNYTRTPSYHSPTPYNTNKQDSTLNINVEKHISNEYLKSYGKISKNTLKPKSTIERLEFLKNKIKEINSFLK